MANQCYQFVFSFSPLSLSTSFQTSGVTAWTPYQEPNYTRGQVRVGGPNNSSNPNGPAGSYLVVSHGDNVYINFVGPQNWTVRPDQSSRSSSPRRTLRRRRRGTRRSRTAPSTIRSPAR